MCIRLPYEHFFDIAFGGNHASLPFGSPSSLPVDASFQNFGFTGPLDDPSTNFFPGWKLITPLGDALSDLLAMFTGLLWLEKVTGPPDYYRLILAIVDPVISGALKHMRPIWIPEPDLVIYENVHLDDVRSALYNIDTESPQLAADNLTYLREQYPDRFDSTTTWNTVVDTFLDVETISSSHSEFPITVTAGLLIGAPDFSPSPSDRTNLELRLFIRRCVSDDPFEEDPENLYLNPSFYMRGWEEFFSGLTGHVLYEEMSTPIWGLITNMHFRYVKQVGGVSGASEQFDDPTRPSSTLNEAIERAQPNDSIVIMDTAIYRENELVINKPLTISTDHDADVLLEGFSENNLPCLDGNNRHRVMRIEPNGDDGIIYIRNLVIKRGRQEDDPSTNYRGGAGIVIEDWNPCIIENCYFTGNKTYWDMNWINVYAQLPLRLREYLDEQIENPVVPQSIRDTLRALKQRMVSTANYGLMGQSFGGAINCLNSSAYILYNYIYDNEAAARGGGIGSAGYGWPVIEQNHIINNRARYYQGKGRPDGGGIGCVVAVPSERRGMALTIEDTIDSLIDWLNRKNDAEIDQLIDDMQTDILTPTRDFYQNHSADFWNSAKLASARDNAIFIVANRIEDNVADDDGGGVYCAIHTSAYLKANLIINNFTTNGSGGGIRGTMGSCIVLDGGTVRGNRAHTSTSINEGNGGGGIGFRNANLRITGDALITENQVNGWAGGGIFFNATTAGGTMYQFHAILTVVFQYQQASLEIDSRVEISNNVTRNIRSGTAHHHAKGGGAYILRAQVLAGRHSGIPLLSVLVRHSLPPVLRDNSTQDATGGEIHDGFRDFMLVDQHTSTELGDADYIAATGDFRYP